MQSKYLDTAVRMDEALLALLEQKDYAYITVKEICARAGVNRSTFYLHYETIDDLLQESLAHVYTKFTSRYDCDPLRDQYLVTPEYILPYLEFLCENKRIFLTAVKKPAVFGVMKQFNETNSRYFVPLLEHYEVAPAERKYVLAYYLSGMHALIIEWIKGGCQEPPQYIAELLMKYTPGQGRG